MQDVSPLTKEQLDELERLTHSNGNFVVHGVTFLSTTLRQLVAAAQEAELLRRERDELAREVNGLREMDEIWLEDSKRASRAAEKTDGESMPEAVERLRQERDEARAVAAWVQAVSDDGVQAARPLMAYRDAVDKARDWRDKRGCG